MKTSINGATQIRAGVVRPEIVIPLSSETERAAPDAADGATEGLLGDWQLGADHSGTVFRGVGTRHGVTGRTSKLGDRGTGAGVAC